MKKRRIFDHLQRPYVQWFNLKLIPEKIAEPLRWDTPKRIFVYSMSDLFHTEVPEE